MLIVCLNMKNYLGRGVDYVNRLKRACWRHAPEHEFVCLTDQPDGPYDRDVNVCHLDTNLPGYWAKIAMFQQGMFPSDEQILYLDLDVVVHDTLGPLIDLARMAEPRLWILGDWEFPLTKIRTPDSYPDGVDEAKVLERCGGLGTCNSSVMLWRGDCAYMLWDDLSPQAADGLHGDQNWINRRLAPDGFNLIPEGYASSYKFGGTGSILVFHGQPKPHDITGPWIQRHWR